MDYVTSRIIIISALFVTYICVVYFRHKSYMNNPPKGFEFMRFPVRVILENPTMAENVYKSKKKKILKEIEIIEYYAMTGKLDVGRDSIDRYMRLHKEFTLLDIEHMEFRRRFRKKRQRSEQQIKIIE